jgi:hypothetical protein
MYLGNDADASLDSNSVTIDGDQGQSAHDIYVHGTTSTLTCSSSDVYCVANGLVSPPTSSCTAASVNTEYTGTQCMICGPCGALCARFPFPPTHDHHESTTNHDTQGHRPSDNEISHDWPQTNNLDIYDHHSTTHQNQSARRRRSPRPCRRRSPRSCRRRQRVRATRNPTDQGPAFADRATLARPCSTPELALGTTHAARAP